MKGRNIKSFNGLRVLAMLLVFGKHLRYLEKTPLGFFPACNIECVLQFFLMLSGFLMARGYSKKLEKRDLQQDMRFIRKRIERIYLPYLLTTLAALPFCTEWLKGLGVYSTGRMVRYLITNIFMVQSAIPFFEIATPINPIAWFISTIFILYLFTPGLLRLNNRIRKRGKKGISFYLILAAGLMVSYCIVYMGIRYIQYVRFPDRNLDIIYINPIIRIFPYLFGIVIYNIVSDGKVPEGSSTGKEVCALSAFLLWTLAGNKTAVPGLIMNCISLMISAFLLYVFAVSEDGSLSRVLGGKIPAKAAFISMEFYLVHYLVIEYGLKIPGEGFSPALPEGLLLTSVFLVCSLFLAIAVRRISDFAIVKLNSAQTDRR